MGLAKKVLTALALSGGILLNASAQEPKEPEKTEVPAKEQANNDGFQFSMPDDSFPDKEGYARIKGEMPTNDYDGKGFGIDGRLPVEGISGAARILHYKGDTHPASTPFVPEPTLPEVGINPVQTLESELKNTSEELSLSIDRLNAFAKYGKFGKDMKGNETSVLTDDAFFYLAVNTKNTVELDSKVFSAGVGYDFGQISAWLAGFTNTNNNDLQSVEDTIFTDKGTGTTIITTTEGGIKTKTEYWGILPSIAYRINDDAQADFHAIIGERKTETNDDTDSDTIIRPVFGGSWKNIFGRAGYINKNREDDGKFLGTLGYVLDLNGVQIPGMVGLDDNGNAYFGGMLVVGNNPDLKKFMLYLPDNTISPLENEIMRENARSHKIEGLARSTSFFAGAYVLKTPELKITEGNTIDESEETRVIPMIGFTAGPVTGVLDGNVGSDRQSGGANFYFMILKNVGVGAGIKYTTAKDSVFDDQITGIISLIGRF